jgi:branched-subunit amino acid permease
MGFLFQKVHWSVTALCSLLLLRHFCRNKMKKIHTGWIMIPLFFLIFLFIYFSFTLIIVWSNNKNSDKTGKLCGPVKWSNILVIVEVNILAIMTNDWQL